MHNYCVRMAELRHVDLSARQIRVLAHPLRARLLAQLRLDGPATATRLAGALGTNTGATSYHLRQLADVGLVEDADHPAAGRERWWRSAHDVSSWRRSAYADDPDAMAAVDWLNSYGVRRLADLVEDWHRAEEDEPEEWREAADFSDYVLHLDAGQLRRLVGELDEVIERHRLAAEAAPAPDARQVLLHVYGLPRVGPS